jgi:hypothetical protein
VPDTEVPKDERCDPTGDDTSRNTCDEGWEDEKNLCARISSHCEKTCLTEGKESCVTQEEIETKRKDRKQKDVDGHVEEILAGKCGKKEKK